MFTSFMYMSVTIMAIFLFGTLGEMLTEKAGHLNLGTPGIMCLGASGTMVGLKIYSNICGGSENTVGILCIIFVLVFTALFAAIGGIIYSFLTITLKSNQNVVGLSLTTLGASFFPVIQNSVGGDENLNIQFIARRDFSSLFPEAWVKNTGWFGQIFLNHSILIFLAIAIAIVMGLVFRKTNIGLSIKAVGENPGTAYATGINVDKIKYLSTLIGAVIAGFGGAVYVLDFSKGTPGIELEAFGWIAVALVISSLWISEFGLGTSLLFAMLYCAPSSYNLGGTGAVSQLFKGLPYLITLVLLILTSILRKKELQAPSALGLPYFREDR